MNDFIEKWNKEAKFKTKIKLSLYTLFVIFVAIFAVSNRAPIEKEEQNKESNNAPQKQEENASIEIPNEYNYKINITINENNYLYTGTKTSKRETIKKEIHNHIERYIYENNKYYKEENENYILTIKEEVYDVVNYDYINLLTINEYLSKSSKKENEYFVYLKDIILGNNSDDYITITINKNDITIDYTKLVNNFDKTIEKYLISIELEDIE